MNGGIEYQKTIGAQNRRNILDAMPATQVEICAKTGLLKDTVEDIVRRMRRAGEVAVVGHVPHPRGGPLVCIYGETEDSARRGPPLVVPVTQYKTQWLGGQHPCEQFNPFCQEAA